MRGNIEEVYDVVYIFHKQHLIANIVNMPLLTDEEFAQINVKHIEAIVMYRKRTGCSLMQAKVVCDNVRENML